MIGVDLRLAKRHFEITDIGCRGSDDVGVNLQPDAAHANWVFDIRLAIE